MKRALALLCVVVLMLGIFSIIASAATTLVPTNIPKSFTVMKQDPKSTVVNFWHAMTGRYATYVDNIANWFNSTEGKKKKIYVKPVFQGDYDAVTVKIQATLQSGNIKDLPDLVQLSAQGAFSVKESKNILYMEDLMAADSSFKIKDKLNKNAMWACSYKGKQLGMPFSNSMIVMYYNATAFKAVGLDAANPPKTLAEYADAAKKLAIKGTGAKPLRYGASNKIDVYQLSTWIPRQKNGTAFQFDMEDGRQGVPKTYPCYKDGTLKASLTEWKKVLDTGVIDYVNNAPRASFEQGGTAMYLSSMVQYDTIMTGYFRANPKKVFDARMYRIPQVNANDSIGEAIGGSAVYMFNKNDDAKKNATWQFVKFLGSVDVSAYWFISSGYFPLNTDAVNTKYVQDALSAAPAKKQLLVTRSDSVNSYKFQEPWIPNYGPYANNIGDQIVLMAKGKLTLDQTVEAIAKKATSILKVYWDANS